MFYIIVTEVDPCGPLSTGTVAVVITIAYTYNKNKNVAAPSTVSQQITHDVAQSTISCNQLRTLMSDYW